ncbi:MAG: hypothetical protein Q7R96_04630, partial [Nanoarchaeota archaeon]|nr:hypothetical protein [Nanoarchaeota archaeon]
MSSPVYEYLEQHFKDSGKIQDFEVQFVTENEKRTKWYSFIEHKDKEYFKKSCATLETHYSRINSEIILDLDKSEEDYAKLRAYLIEHETSFTAYRSGGARDMYHVHIIVPEMLELSIEEVETIRLFLIEQFNADQQLKINRHLIAVPGTKRFSTGKTKREIEKNDFGKNTLTKLINKKEFEEWKRIKETNRSIPKSFIFDEKELVQRKDFVQDIHQEELIIGMRIPEQMSTEDKYGKRYRQAWSPVIITSGKRFIPLTGTFEFENKIEFKVIPEEFELRWGLKCIKDFLDGKTEQVIPQELFNQIVDLYKKFLFFLNEEWYKVRALWDIGTYFFNIFDAYPLYENRGGMGAAKTKSMEISRRITFNACRDIIVNPSEAVLFRETHSKRPTKYIDEAEKLFRVNKGIMEADNRVELINASYKKGASVPRIEEKAGKRITVFYETYSPTQIASINGLFGATEDRAIIQTHTRAPPNDPRGNKDPNEEPQTTWENVRNQLYIFMMENWKTVKQTYNAFSNETSLNNREFQIWKPLLCLAKIIDETLYAEVRSFAETSAKIKKMDQ